MTLAHGLQGFQGTVEIAALALQLGMGQGHGQLGLRLAWQDGSLKQLWRQHFQPSLAFTQLASRQLFRLSNPRLPGEGSDYSSYLYDPARDAFGMPPHDKADRVGK